MKSAIFIQAKRFAGRVMLKASKHSPELLLIAGVGLGIAATVTACKATLRPDEVLDEHADKMEKVKGAIKIAEDDESVTYDVSNAKKDTAIIYAQTAWNFVKLYGPSVALGAAGIACLLASYGILHGRYIGAVAAYNGLSEAFKRYRAAVVEDQGIEADRLYFEGRKPLEIRDENGRVVDRDFEKGAELTSLDRAKCSQYAKFFDSCSREFEKGNPEYNLIFLRAQQAAANNLLQTRGHLFLNEVYDMLDIRRTAAGAVVGWVIGNGDNFVDFGIFTNDEEGTRRFVNGYEDSILLDFNVDGVIYNLI